LTFEVITRRIDDRGGGLARVNGRVRLIEGLAMPREEAEFALSYYNSMTTWINLDKLLAVFRLAREDIADCVPGIAPVRSSARAEALSGSGKHAGQPPAGGPGLAVPLSSSEEKVAAGIRALAAKMPTYVTLKEVKRRWGRGQEDIFPVMQFEKLWGDMTALGEAECRFVVVPRLRGQQLKDQAQLDAWLRDGSAAYVESLCDWE